MSSTFDVAEAKSRFSELLNRAGYGKERFVIRKRGRPVAAIVSVEDLSRLEDTRPTEPEGLLAAAGALGEFDEYAQIMDEIVRDRVNRRDREVSLD